MADEDAERTLFEGRPAVWIGVGDVLISVLTLGLGALYLWIRSRSAHYKLTTRRVIVERGLLSKQLEQIDNYRIKDYVVERPFGQRLLGTGNLLLHTMDQTTPSLRLIGLRTDVVALYEQLRTAAEAERERRNVRLLDNE
jgi:uncharacterized membrane protein YdbT with pleckstrin-like domain